MRLFGLIGFPLSHSFSKRYFSEKFRQPGLQDCRYELFPLENIHGIKKLVADHPDLLGLNVTIPHKQSVIPFLDRTFLPETLPACNCIWIREGKLWGFNTDHLGFEKSLLPQLRPHHKKALVLGTGGASLAVRYVLEKLGIAAKFVSRAIKPGVDLAYADITRQVMEESLLIINTTPLGMYPHVQERPPIPYQYIGSDHLLFDLVYNPEKTLFLQKGEERGAATCNGLDMLAFQAEESWSIWNQQMNETYEQNQD